MLSSPARTLLLLTAVACTAAVTRAHDQERASSDRLAAEISRWSAVLDAETRTDEIWTQVREGARTALNAAAEALQRGHRVMALERLAAARQNLAAARYVLDQPAIVRRDLAAFEREWERMRSVLGRDATASPQPDALATLRGAAHRALAEAALAQVRVYFDASLEYGRNTEPRFGLFYLGAAQAQRDLVPLLRSLGSPAPARAPVLRRLSPELDELQAGLLTAYRPPASIERHPEFIAASATIKEAHELDDAGLRHAALLRYLQAAQRVAALRPGTVAGDTAALAASVKEVAGRVTREPVDHSIAQLFVERAQAALAGSDATTAAAIVNDVLPRYFAALAPPAPAPPRPDARVTVTLVRWPFT